MERQVTCRQTCMGLRAHSYLPAEWRPPRVAAVYRLSLLTGSGARTPASLHLQLVRRSKLTKGA